MSYRPPEGLAAQMIRDTGINVLESELLAEKASSLLDSMLSLGLAQEMGGASSAFR